MPRSCYPAFCCFLALLFLAGPVRAEPDDRGRARKHFERALELVRDGQVVQAAAEFRAAYELSPHYAVLFNLAKAYSLLGEHAKAWTTFTRYLKEGGDQISAERRSEVEKALSLHASHIALVTIELVPDDARVELDGRALQVPPSGDALALSPGRHFLRVSKDGFVDQRVVFKLAAGESKVVRVTLEPPAPEPEPSETEVVVERGGILVDCPIPAVDVVVDGEVVRQTPVDRPLSVAVGTREVIFRRTGYHPRHLSVRVDRVLPVRIECALTPNPAAVPFRPLVVRGLPSSAVISVNGRTTGRMILLPPGPHLLTISAEGFRPFERTVSVAGEGETVVRPALVPLPGAGSRFSTREKAAFTLAGSGAAFGFTAVGTALWNRGRFTRWERRDAELESIAQGGPPFPSDARDRQTRNDNLLRSIRRTDRVSIAFGVTGVGLLATGAAVYWMKPEKERPAVNLAVSSRHAAVTWSRRW